MSFLYVLRQSISCSLYCTIQSDRSPGVWHPASVGRLCYADSMPSRTSGRPPGRPARFLRAARATFTSSDSDVQLRQGRQGTPRRREIRRALARRVPPERSARPAWGAPRRARAHRRARRAPHARAARGGVRARHPDRRAAGDADRAVRRAREPQLEDRAPDLVGAVRPDAGLPARLPGVRSRGGNPRLGPVAGDAARARAAPDRAPRTRREDPPLPLRAVDPREVGGAAHAVLARAVEAHRAAARDARPRERADDDRASLPARARAAARARGQHDGQAPRVPRRRAPAVVPAAAARARAPPRCRPPTTSTSAGARA